MNLKSVISLVMTFTGLLLPISGYCQSSAQSGLPIVIQDEKIKKNLREQLAQRYQPLVYNASGDIYRIVLAAKDTEKEKDKSKDGGTWTGGGGSGIACFEKWEAYKDSREFILPEAYDQMTMLTMLDIENKSIPIVPAKAGETSMDYIRRLMTEAYAPVLPLFAAKILRTSELIYSQLQNQVADYQKEPNYSAQPTLRDFGAPMIQEEIAFPGRCIIVQLATRYAKVELYEVQGFFIDFDVRLVLKFKELATNPEETAAQEAALILHEALYLMGSVIEHSDSSATAFGIMPLLLSKRTTEILKTMPRTVAAEYLRSKLKQYGMSNYHFVKFVNEKKSQNPVINQHLMAVKQIKKSLVQAEQQFKKTYGYSSHTAREYQSYLKPLVENLLKSTDPTGAFIALSSLVAAKHRYILDDLFLESFEQKAVIADLCTNLKEQRQDLIGDRAYPAMVQLFERALDYCRQK